MGESEITRDVYLLAKIHEIHHTKIHEDTLAAHIGRRYTFFGIQEALFRIEELHTRVLSGSKNFTPAGGPSKRLPRPPRDPWRRGNKEVSRARCALCAPAYAPPRAPSVRRIDPPRAHCCPHCAQASALNVIGHDTIFDMKSARGLGDEVTNETKPLVGGTRAVPPWHRSGERVTAEALWALAVMRGPGA